MFRRLFVPSVPEETAESNARKMIVARISNLLILYLWYVTYQSFRVCFGEYADVKGPLTNLDLFDKFGFNSIGTYVLGQKVNFQEETTSREDLQMLFEPFGELV